MNGTENWQLKWRLPLCMVVKWLSMHPVIYSSKMLVCPTQRLTHTTQQWVLIKHLPAGFHVACYIWCIKISSWPTACPNMNLLEASSGRHHSHLSSAPTRLLTHALGSNLSLVVRGCLSLDLCPLSHYTLCPSFLQWFVLLWHCSSQLELNAYKVYTFHMLILLGS